MSADPNAAPASERQAANACGRLSRSRTTRMPRPPPPAAAFKMIGYPICAATSWASSASRSGVTLPGTIGTLACCASWRACALSPIRRIASGDGPTKVIEQERQISAKAAFSARKPYPGWIASLSVTAAADTIAGMFR